MGSTYLNLDQGNLDQEWNSLREFLGIQESYLIGVTGDNDAGYRFHYRYSNVSYLSDGVYLSRSAAIDGLNLALLRSFIFNSDLSVFVISDTNKIVLQSEKNISKFGWKREEAQEAITDKEAHWGIRWTFGYLVFREFDGGTIDQNRGSVRGWANFRKFQN